MQVSMPGVAVDAVTENVEPADAEAAALERAAELDDELADGAGDRLRRTDRLGKGLPHLDDIGRADRLDRLRHSPERLVDAPDGSGPKRRMSGPRGCDSRSAICAKPSTRRSAAMAGA